MTDLSEPRAREHPELDGIRERVRYCVDLMAAKQWERGKTAPELARVWGCTLSCVENYSAEAARHLEYLGERDYWLARIRSEADRRLSGAEDQHFAAIARVAADTVGGFAQKHEVTATVAPASPAELADGCIEWLLEHAPERLVDAAARARKLLKSARLEGA